MIVAATERASAHDREQLANLGCEVLVLSGGDRVSVEALLDELGRSGMSNVLVEGGRRVLGSFLDAGQVDAVNVFIAPSIEGGDHSWTAVRGRGIQLMRETPPVCVV